LHDVVDLDGRGVAAVIVATTAFQQAAEVQSASLGYDPAIVWVPHPVQDRTDAELHQMADTALADVLKAITPP
jgi:hypothetical protein